MELWETPLFRGITREDCRRMARCFQAAERTAAPGQTLYDFDSGPEGIGILVAGKAEVVRLDIDGNRTILETLETGQVFGRLFTYYAQEGDSLTVAATQDCRAVLIGQEHLVKRCGNACVCHSALVENLLEMVSAKAVYLSARVEILSRRTIREKLLCYFRYRSYVLGSDTFQLPFSMSSLAEYISSDRSAMMRELRQMKEEGLVETDRRRVRLKKGYEIEKNVKNMN